MIGVRAVPALAGLMVIVLLGSGSSGIHSPAEAETNDPQAIFELSLDRDDLAGHELPMSHNAWVPYMEAAALMVPEGVRPGAWINMGNSYCTASFVVEDENGKLYLTTAGHCTQSTGQRASILHNTPVAGAAEWEEFGTIIGRWPSGLDAALIEIDADWYDLVDPSMPGWGGPTGVASSNPGDAYHYGWGWVTWQEHNTRCRTASTYSWGPTTWWIQTETYGGGGDSGSAVMNHQGEAVGILNWATNIQQLPAGLDQGAFYSDQLGGLRFDVALNALSSQTGHQLSLVEGGPITAIPGAGPVGEQCSPDPPLV